MRVLFVSTSYPRDEGDPRGIHVHRLAASLASLGVDVSVVVPAGRRRGRDYQLSGVHVHPVNYWIPKYQGLADGLHGIVPNIKNHPALALLVPFMLVAMGLATMRRASSADVVHAHWIVPSGVIGAGLRRRGPLVITSHGGDIDLAGRSKWIAGLARWAARRADRCLGVSEALTQQLVRLGVPETICAFQPLGVDVTEATNADRPHDADAWGADLRSLRVVFVGSLIERKQPQQILAAMRLLVEEGYPVRCAFVGDGPLRSALETSALSAVLDVHFAGDTPPCDVRGWLRHADVLVLPSLSEGRPVVIMEAMAESLPVVATDIPGIAELVEDGRTGYLVRAHSATGIAAALKAISDDPESARRMGSSGRAKLVVEGLTIDQVAEAHVALYSSLLRGD